MSKGIQYQSNDAPVGQIQEFYNRLLEFDTTISDSNMFYVSYDLPSSLNDDLYAFIGESSNDRRVGINKTKEKFQRSNIQALTIGVDIPDDSLSTQVLEHESKSNGYIPITVNSARNLDTTGLTTTFYDTNLSLNDIIFKPWIRLISRYGSFNQDLYTNIQVVFLGRHIKFDSTLIRKMYTFYDCIPVDTQNKDSYKYAADPTVIEQRVKWKFNRYDVVLTNI